MTADWLSTKFWLSLTAQVLVLLAILGILPSQDVESVNQFIAQIICAVAVIVSNLAYLAHYVVYHQLPELPDQGDDGWLQKQKPPEPKK